jgi:hypothetical protein
MRKTWRMYDGTKIAVKDMTDRHLRSTVKMLWGHDNLLYNSYIIAMTHEALRRKPCEVCRMASACLNDKSLVPVLADMLEERGDERAAVLREKVSLVGIAKLFWNELNSPSAVMGLGVDYLTEYLKLKPGQLTPG